MIKLILFIVLIITMAGLAGHAFLKFMQAHDKLNNALDDTYALKRQQDRIAVMKKYFLLLFMYLLIALIICGFFSPYLLKKQKTSAHVAQKFFYLKQFNYILH